MVSFLRSIVLISSPTGASGIALTENHSPSVVGITNASGDMVFVFTTSPSCSISGAVISTSCLNPQRILEKDSKISADSISNLCMLFSIS